MAISLYANIALADDADSPTGQSVNTTPSQHWSLQPLIEAEGDPSVDSYVRRRLSKAGLSPNPPARRETLIRRLYLDMHGLPPTPEQISTFLADAAPGGGAFARVVEEVLASPRYGERWAQHWLDVVRYADTDGFEVNTPRENAWPYRDYVISAFNEDKPYNQFIREQLAGDTCGQDAATGFLVAAPALLSGQIGKDAASIRLARQDALDEIIVGTSATFLGLTVGCARCHDHKFDPITQRDYYAMQAFFAGVEYGEREVEDDQREENLRKASELAPQIDQLEKRLIDFQPLAFNGRTLVIDDEVTGRVTLLKEKKGHGVNPEGADRGYRDDVGSDDRMANLSRGRYTWWTNVPDEDVFTYDPKVAETFRIWLSWGVHGSGVHTRDARYWLDRDGDIETKDDQHEIAQVDQYYFSNVTEGESEKNLCGADYGMRGFTN